jgi:hypothetical protein
MALRFQRTILGLPIFLLSLSACSTYEVDSLSRYCEWVTDDRALENNSPFWAVFPGVRFSAEGIRADIASVLNAMYMEQMDGRTDQMVWQEGRELHMTNIASFFVVEKETFENDWATALNKAKNGDYDLDTDPAFCVNLAISVVYDSLHIHYLDIDQLNQLQGEDVWVYDNERQKRADGIPKGTLIHQ